MNFTQLEEIWVMLEARMCVSLIVLVVTYLLLQSARRHHHQDAVWKRCVRANRLHVVERNLNQLLFGQLGALTLAAMSFLVMVWTPWYVRFWLEVSLVMMVLYLLMAWLRTAQWQKSKMPTPTPATYRDTQVG